jgi:hypothetical protein
MEEFIFYQYLKHRKENPLQLYKAIKTLPLGMIVAWMISLVAAIVGFVLLYIPQTNAYSWIPIVVELLACVVTYFWGEWYQVKFSETHIENYRNKHMELYEWLKRIGVQTQEQVLTLKDRATERVKAFEAKQQRNGERVDKWMHAIIIPTVLAVLAWALNQTQELSGAVSAAVTVLLLAGSICGLVALIRNAISIYAKYKVTKWQEFSHILQAVYDTEFVFKKD